MRASKDRHWPRLRRLTWQLSLAWFLITVLTIWFARDLAKIQFFGWQLSFYLAAQGAVLGFLAVVGAYAWYAARLEQGLRQDEHGN